MNKFSEKSRNSYNKKAENYDETFDGKFTWKFKKKLLEVITLNDGDKVLDVACGNGKLLNMMKEKKNILGYGTDISEKMVEEGKKLNPEMEFVAGDCENIPLEGEYFDIITVCVGFHHFPNVEGFYKECLRLLKSGGRVYIAEVYYPKIIRKLMNPFLHFSKAGDVKFYSPEEISEGFKRFGFSREEGVIEGNMQIVVVRKGKE